MAEPSEIFLPASAALAAIEARLAADWTLLSVTGMRVRKGDATPDPDLTLDYTPEGTSDLDAVTTALGSWPVAPDLFAETRFTTPLIRTCGPLSLLDDRHGET